MKYGVLLDGQLIYAKEYFVCEDGSIIINFNGNEKYAAAENKTISNISCL